MDDVALDVGRVNEMVEALDLDVAEAVNGEPCLEPQSLVGKYHGILLSCKSEGSRL